MRAALFDMDRTLVRVNTASEYVRWQLATGQIGLSQAVQATGWILQYKFGLVDPAVVSRRALRTLAGRAEEEFEQACVTWFRTEIRGHITEAARREVERRRSEGSAIAICTASTRFAAGPLADELGIEHVLCTRLEVAAGRFTGRTAGPLCYGAAKVRAAERWAAENGIDLGESAFYSDSISDLPLLARVGEPWVVNPDPRLRGSAVLRGWPVVHWK